MDNSRQEDLVVTKSDTYHIVGCGGVGSWIALWLGKALPEATFHLWDGDLIAPSNLHRTPYAPDRVGHSKGLVLRDILMAHGVNRVFSHGHWTPSVDMISQGEVVICAVDSMRVRRELYDYKSASRIEYWDVGAEGTGCNLSDSPADFEIDNADAHQGYFTPIFIGPVATVAALTVWRILRGMSPVDMRIEERANQLKVTGG